MLGYDATNMLWGLQAWTMDNDVRAKYFNPETHLNEFPFVGAAAEGVVEEVVVEEEVEPEALPETGGAPFPLEGVLVGFGALTAAAGLYRRRREAA